MTFLLSRLSQDTNYQSYCKLLLYGEGADAAVSILDHSPIPKTVTPIGTAQIDTAQYKYGAASLLLDGNSDYFTLADSADWFFSTGPFGIRTWWRAAALPGAANYQFFYNQAVDDNNFFRFGVWNSAGTYYWIAQLYEGGLATFSWSNYPAGALATNAWYYVEFVRNGNDFNFYKNGTDSGVTHTQADDIPNFAGAVSIGVYKSPATTAYYVNGWLDDFEVLAGVAPHTAGYTAPTDSPYTITLRGLLDGQKFRVYSGTTASSWSGAASGGVAVLLSASGFGLIVPPYTKLDVSYTDGVTVQQAFIYPAGLYPGDTLLLKSRSGSAPRMLVTR